MPIARALAPLFLFASCAELAQSGDTLSDVGEASTASGVVITAPASGATLSGAVEVKASAHESVAINQLQVWDNGVKLGVFPGATVDAAFTLGAGDHALTVEDLSNSFQVLHKTTVGFTVTSCGAPAIVSPAAGAQTGTSVVLKTQAPSCLTATKCYLNGNAVAVASQGAGAVDATIAVQPGSNTLECNGWDKNGAVYKSATVTVTSAAPDAGSPPAQCGAAQVPLASLTAHNTSASPNYDRNHFAANFGTTTWVSQGGATMAVDPGKMDLSQNPITPGHVSHADVHTLIPSRPDLRWFAHVVPWFKTGGVNHIDIGIESASMPYIQTMVEDIKSRGFDGLIVDWYGQGSYEDKATLLIQSYLKSIPNNTFKIIVMMDKGIPNLSQSVLEQQIRYVQSQYFSDPSYEREGGKPILMFFGVTNAIGGTAMAAAKSATGGNMVWVTQGAGTLSDAWVDQSFDWTHDFHNGPSGSDPYNLSAVAAYYAAVAGSSKHAFGSMAAGFNGMLTKSVAWSKGKYLPRGSGACVIEWAKKIDAVIPANVTRMQWATWSDWEEGTQIETGVENDAVVTAHVSGSTLSWSTVTGTGDESTLDHYALYASADGVNAVELAKVSTATHAFDLHTSACLASGKTYGLQVVAVGRPIIRDHISASVSYAAP
jgi:hypothetical protein